MIQQRYASSRCQEYSAFIPHHPRGCPSCVVHREGLEKRYGLPTANEGLKKFHADSSLSVDGLLRSCRRIYGEARALPFKLYSFDVDDEHLRNMLTTCDEYLRNMLTTWMEPWQVAHIERLHLSVRGGEVEEMKNTVMEFLPGLKVLEVDFDDEGMVQAFTNSWTGLKIGKVEVVAGADRDWGDDRRSRRMMAERLERVMGSVQEI